MKKTNTAWTFIATVVLAFAAVGCGGGGGDDGDNGPRVLEISGLALEPAGLLVQLGSVLQPIPGATVELIEVDLDGNQVGGVLAMSITSTTGAYSLVLPDGLSLSAMLMVRVTGTSGTLRGLVVSDSVDLTPASEYVTRKLTSGGNTLDNVTPNEVLTISGYIEEFDLSVGATIEETIALLDEAAGPSLAPLLDLAQQGPGNANAIAGTFFVHSFDMPIADYPETRVLTWAADLTMQAGQNGAFTLTDIDGSDSGASLWASDNGAGGANYSLQTSFDLDLGSPNLQGQVSADDSFTILIPLEEEIFAPGEGGFPGGLRSPSNALTFCPVGDGLYAAIQYYEETEYDMNAAGTAIDLSQPRGNSREFDMITAVKKGPIANSSLDGATFGIVSFGLVLNAGGSRELFGDVGTMGVTTTGTTTGTLDMDLQVLALDRIPVGNSLAADVAWVLTGDGVDDPTPEQETDNGVPYSLDPATGALTIAPGSGEAESGCVTSGGQFLTVALDLDEGNPITEACRGTLIGLRLGTVNPTVSGKSYKVLLLERGMDTNGSSSILRLLGATIELSGESDAQVTGTASSLSRLNDFGTFAVEAGTEAVDVTGSFEFTGTNGAITFDLDGSTLTGFMAADGSSGIFRIHTSDIDEDGNASIGIAILIEKS